MRSEDEVNRALKLYADTVRRICFLHLKNYADVEDVFQEVFLKYLLNNQDFESDAHEKAWLIRVSINASKDILKSFFRRKVFSLEAIEREPFYFQKPEYELMDAILQLKPKERDLIYLFYYEGYRAVEIATMLGEKENTIYSRLSRAREQLRQQMGGDGI